MKVFISWSGKRSKVVAQALRQWIPSVFQSVEPWMSEVDIKAGSRWRRELAEKLEGVKFGIVCVTPENQDAPWLHFEAGAIAKTIDNDTYVCPYLIDIQPTELRSGPLTEFQAIQANREGTLRLVEAINPVIEKPLQTNILEDTFRLWWPGLEKTLSELPGPESKQEVKRPLEDMMEEVLELVRQMARPSRGFGSSKAQNLLRYIEGIRMPSNKDIFGKTLPEVLIWQLSRENGMYLDDLVTILEPFFNGYSVKKAISSLIDQGIINPDNLNSPNPFLTSCEINVRHPFDRDC